MDGVSRVVEVGVASVLGEVAFVGEIAGEPAGPTPISAQPEVDSKKTGTSMVISKWEPIICKRLPRMLLVPVRGEFISATITR